MKPNERFLRVEELYYLQPIQFHRHTWIVLWFSLVRSSELTYDILLDIQYFVYDHRNRTIFFQLQIGMYYKPLWEFSNQMNQFFPHCSQQFYSPKINDDKKFQKPEVSRSVHSLNYNKLFFHHLIRTCHESWLELFTSYVCNVFLTKVQRQLPRKSRDKMNPNGAFWS